MTLGDDALDPESRSRMERLGQFLWQRGRYVGEEIADRPWLHLVGTDQIVLTVRKISVGQTSCPKLRQSHARQHAEEVSTVWNPPEPPLLPDRVKPCHSLFSP